MSVHTSTAFGIKVISLEPVPRSELGGEFQYSQQEVDEWRYFALHELRGKLLRELVKIYPPRHPASGDAADSPTDRPYTWRQYDLAISNMKVLPRKAQATAWKDEEPPGWVGKASSMSST